MNTFRLILARHGEAQSRFSLTDMERPLTISGREQAYSLGREISQMGWIPQYVLSSAATRAIETTQEIIKSWPDDILWHSETQLYLTNHREIINMCKTIDSDCHTLLLVGHNPTWSDLVRLLTKQVISLGTAEAACLKIDHQSDWESALQATGCWKLCCVIQHI